MIRATLTLQGRGAQTLGRAIGPDNLPDMLMKADGENLRFEFCAQKMGTMLATLDDLLMNLKVAEETMVCGDKR